MTNQILKGTTLAAIVRDEEMNPAGGVEKWLRATLPYLERAVVVDTGSIDRTREILESLRTDFPHLEVYDRPFDDFASSRNFSLSKVRTQRALVLDADELLMPEEYQRLEQHVAANPNIIYSFVFKEVYPDIAPINVTENPQVTRLFDVEGAEFKNSVDGGFCEYLGYPFELKDMNYVPTGVAMIKHFMPPRRIYKLKEELWYNGGGLNSFSPLVHAREHGWKEECNPRVFFESTEALRRAEKLFPSLAEKGDVDRFVPIP